MNKIVTVTQHKGGVGKTTLAVSVAAELSSRGKEVALVDADPQRSASQWAELGHLAFPVYELPLAEQAVASWTRSLNEVAAKHGCVVVDTAPNVRARGASITISSLVIVPCTPSGLDLEAAASTLQAIDEVRVSRRGLPGVIIVPNRVDPRTLEGRQLVEELKRFGEVVSPKIGYRSAFVRAFAAGRPIAPNGDGRAAHEEIRTLCDLVEEGLDFVFAANIDFVPEFV